MASWNPPGATILFGEFGQDNDQFESQMGADKCATGSFFFARCSAVPVGLTGQGPSD